MKKYYTDYESLADAWVHEGASGIYSRGHRMNADFERIYSYGSHFVIAHRWNLDSDWSNAALRGVLPRSEGWFKPASAGPRSRDWFFLTERRDSNTTERHKFAVWSALPQERTILCPQVDYMSDWTAIFRHLYESLPNKHFGGTKKDKLNALGEYVLKLESDRLEKYLAKFMRRRRIIGFDALNDYLKSIQLSVARFGREIPKSFAPKIQKARDHAKARVERTKHLDSIALAKSRLLAA